MSLLELTGITKVYRSQDGADIPVLDIPRFEMADGEQVALRAPSGAGKTTLLNVIAGITLPDTGSVCLAGLEMTALSETKRDAARASLLGYVFQTFNLLEGYSALENVVLAMSLAGRVDHERARSLLDRVGLGARMHSPPSRLSVGQQQRVAVARALANRPRLVLADEPTGNLDRQRAMEVLALVREACHESEAALLLVSHDSEVLGGFSRIVHLEEMA